jgi:hypothetical protein
MVDNSNQISVRFVAGIAVVLITSMACSAGKAQSSVDAPSVRVAGVGTTSSEPAAQPVLTGHTNAAEHVAQQPVPISFPPELVGDWQGTDRGRPVYLTFSPDGEFVRRDATGKAFRSGTATVDGGTIMWKDDAGSASSSTIALQGGSLLLDGYSYLRLDAVAGGATALAGSWLDTAQLYVTLRLGRDGSFALEDQNRGTTFGTYMVSDRQLTLTTSGQAPLTFQWSVDNAALTLVAPDGSVSIYTRIG